MSKGRIFFGMFFLLICFAQLQSQINTAVPSQVPAHDAILLGTDWYPEQWPESRWEEDLRLMEAAHIKVVRISEFAWSMMEPSEGQFHFEFFDRAIALAAKHGMVTVVGTPTAAPPAWLTQKYPETLRVEENGKRATHGNRAQASPTSPKYRELCRRIAEQMAMHFGHNPNVAGWQIDNEYGYAQMSYDDGTKAKFQGWLKDKYQTLDNLNALWATSYWSQTYDNWSEIPIPIGPHNPALMLDWKRFVTHEYDEYQRVQIEAIHKNVEPRQFVTTNFMGYFDGYDHYILSEPLDFVSWDDYVGTGHLDYYYNGLAHDLTRGFKRKNFWVIETQPGAVNWQSVNNYLNKGEVRAMAWHAVAHGADEVGYWQWRSALNGQEEYHGTLIGADGTPVPLYDEISQIGREFSATQGAFQGTTPVSEVALLHSYDSHWAIQFQKHTQKYDDRGLLKSYYTELRKLAQSVDVVNPYAPLTQYKLVVAPSLNIVPKDLAAHLLEYVRNGGHLVLGPRSAMKDETNGLLPQRQPGYLIDALGGRVEQYYALEKEFPIAGTWGNGQAIVWAEQLKTSAPDVQVLLRYGKSNGWLDDQPAAITRPYGKGRITYIGAVLDGTLTAAAANWMIQQSGVKPVFGDVPDGVEVSRRRGDNNKDVFVLINFSAETKSIGLPRTMKLLLQNKQGTSLELPQYGVEVLTEVK